LFGGGQVTKTQRPGNLPGLCVSSYTMGISILKAKKGLRGPVFMAYRAGFLRLLARYCPDMGLVALLAFHARVLNMELVFADGHDIFMARQAVAPVRP